jgi:anti-sigma factor RsiW
MSGRVVRLDPATHKVVDTLLPWFVNGTLDADERALVERHVAECARCRQEVEWLRGLHAACVAGEASPEGSGAFRKLRRRLEAPRRRAGRASARFLHTPWTHWVMGVQLVLIAGLGALMFQDTFQDADRAGRYRTLAAPSAVLPARGALVVVFDPNTPEIELRRVLREAGARVVDGPTASNAYVLDVPSNRQAQALQTLRAERAVALAEELAPRSAQ